MNNNEPYRGVSDADNGERRSASNDGEQMNNDEPDSVGAGRTTNPEQQQQTAEGTMPARGTTEATDGGVGEQRGVAGREANGTAAGQEQPREVNDGAILNEPPLVDDQQQLDEENLAALLLVNNGGVQDEPIVQEQQLADLVNTDEFLAGIRHTFVNFRNRANWEIDRIGGRLQGIRHTLVNFRDPANAEIDRIDGRLQGRFAVLGRLIRQCDDFINYLGVLANLLDELRRQGANSVPGSSDVLLIPLNCVTMLRLFLIVLRATMSLSMEPVPFAMLSVTCVCLSSSFFGYFHMITVYFFVMFLLLSLIHLLPLYYHFFG
ncbi:hypothetical protein niasHT_036443 [Heterodera trifolii]|uniref:Uncharacterized protein n=1 Tax=Heterodera trifolii TaxID=157864 RepID=A0ABD2IVA0_9BILA